MNRFFIKMAQTIFFMHYMFKKLFKSPYDAADSSKTNLV